MTLTRPDAFFADTKPAGELPDVPTEIPRHRGTKQPWIRNADDTGPAPAVVQERHRDGSPITVLADPRDSRRGRYYGRASSFWTLDDKYKIQRATQRRIVWAMGRHPELVMRAQAVRDMDDRSDRDELEAIADQAALFGKGDAASTKGTAFHRLRERRDQGEDLSYLDPLTLQGLDTWERLISPFEVIGSEGFVVNDELEAAGSYDALLKLVRTITIRSKTGEVLGAVERGESVIGDMKTGKWGPEWFGPTYGCQGLVYTSGAPYTHDSGRGQWPGGQQPSQRWAVIPYVSLDPAAPPAGLYWIDLDRARRAVAAVAEVKAIRADRLMFVAHQEEPMPVDLAAAGQRAVGERWGDSTWETEDGTPLVAGPGGRLVPLLDLIAKADGKVALSRLWAQHADIWTPEHTAAGQARLAQLEGGAS